MLHICIEPTSGSHGAHVRLQVLQLSNVPFESGWQPLIGWQEYLIGLLLDELELDELDDEELDVAVGVGVGDAVVLGVGVGSGDDELELDELELDELELELDELELDELELDELLEHFSRLALSTQKGSFQTVLFSTQPHSSLAVQGTQALLVPS